jgi:HD-GYP domain-containing protein (c-di-GMP phosphodiesterase class II)
VPIESLAKPEVRSYSLAEQAGALAVVLREEFGTDFSLFDAATGAPVEAERVSVWEGTAAEPRGPDRRTWHAAAALEPGEVRDLAAEGRARVVPLARGGYRLALVLYRSNRPVLVAAAALPALARSEADAGREQVVLRRWLQAVSDRLRLSDQLVVRRRQDEERQTQAAAPWEALLTIDQVARRLRVSRQPDKCVQRLLEGAFGLLGVQTLAWVPQHPDGTVLIHGKALLAPADCRQLAATLAKGPDFRPPGPVLCEQFQARSGAARFPAVSNLMAFQVADQVPVGWVIAINKFAAGARPDGDTEADITVTPCPRSAVAPFRKSDAALLTPFVGLLELYLRSSNRYQDLKDLLVGLTRALTTALDAKDSYTFGHSERVARIAVELGRELGLEGDELGDIYLTGLLHDVGKIGIRDTVLLKPDVLTAEEREHVKQHVTIGYSILADLRQIRNLLPGVLYHHERWDGTGYPDGLAGENIPLLARILAVADAYDAMSNARPYRDALPCRKVEEILLEGSGTQWDAQVVEAFMRCRQKIHTIRQRGVGDSLRLAIEGTLRSEVATLRQSPRPGL